MKILNTLNNEETTSTEKLETVANFVKVVRERYGNADKEITPNKVYTSEGYVPISLLSNDEKVVVATQEIKEAIAMATAGTENTEGAIFDRVLEALIAVNPILVNLDMESDSAY
jgi:hypothetical protein